MKPMLAAAADLNNLWFPYYASPKFDGVRAMVVDGVLVSRSLKPIANKYAQKLFGRPKLNGYDGELIVGSPVAKDVFRVTSSAMNTEKWTPDVTFFVFDLWNSSLRLMERLGDLVVRASRVPATRIVENVLVTSRTELDAYEAKALELGFEGVMLRKPHSFYKFGRSTAREGGMLKVKRFADSEAEILEVIEGQHNGNEAKTNLLGRTERSAHKENMVGMGEAGALRVRDIHSNVEFQLAGFTQNDCDAFWLLRESVIGKIVKYKFFPIGVKDKPRFPVYQGMRDPGDMS